MADQDEQYLCGRSVEDGASACPKCGAPLEPERLPTVAAMAVELAADPKNAWFFDLLERDAAETARRVSAQPNPFVNYRKAR